MVKKSNNSSIEELTQREISAVDKADRLSKLERDAVRNKRLIEGYKEREKTSARALVLYERKIQYLKELVIKSILNTCGGMDKTKIKFEESLKDVKNEQAREQLSEYINDLSSFESDLYDICNKFESTATISKQDRDFISNVKPKEEPNPNDLNSRFERLKLEFEQKIGSSAYRKRGRPKREEQSIVAEIGLGKKLEKQVEEQTEVEDKIKDIFYTAPKNKGATSDIPQTNDSIFDFNEALNPNISLKDIMNEIMSEKPEEEKKVYGTDEDFERVNNLSNMSRAELLESGFIRPITRHKK